MGRKILNRCLFGGPAGLTVWFLFVLFSGWLRGGELIVVSGHAVITYGSELAAFAAAGLSAMAVGMLWASASLIYQVTDWSLLKQTAVNCLICTVPSLAIAYWMEWMPHSLDGLEQYVRLFAAVYVLIWLVQYLVTRRQLRRINEKLRET